MEQIILVTDGCSNQGMSPVSAAAHARANGIIVNVIGVLGPGEGEWGGLQEIEAIAAAGGGLHRVIRPDELARTMQMMTRHTIASTIRGVVNRELKAILGDERAGIETLPPHQRAEVVRKAEEWTEQAPLRVALLIDTSASMQSKLEAVREAAADLLLSLRARAGRSELSVLHYPGASGPVDIDAPWTSDLENLNAILYKLNVKGATPTGPALFQTCCYIKGEAAKTVERRADGVWGDYVV